MSHRFWTGGRNAFAAAIREEYASKKRALKQRLREAETWDEQCRLTEALRQLEAEYTARRRAGDRSLF